MAEVLRQASEGKEGASSERSELLAPSFAIADRQINPEVVTVPGPRRFTADYKLKVLAAADQCHVHGDIGLLLRQEGLYHSTLQKWKQWRKRLQAQGVMMELIRDPGKDLREENTRLLRENKRLELKLKKAEALLDLQKKVSELMRAHEGEASEGINS